MGQADTIIHARALARTQASSADVAPRLAIVRDQPAENSKISLSVHCELAAAEQDWRRLEQTADCTPFQTFDWLSAWYRHIGARSRLTPAIVTGKRGDEILFLLPLAVERRRLARRLTFFGQDLCDYNAPLLAPDFSRLIGPKGFPALWHEICVLLQATRALRHDTIALEKMPATIGAQDNPLLCLDVRLNPSGAYETALVGDWEQFYSAKRSSATRRRDRTKLKRLGELGEVRFVNPEDKAETERTLGVLVEQKTKSFARMGVPNMFARPGYTEFFRELAASPSMRGLVHLSRLDVGATWAALNLGLTFRDCYYHVLASYDDGEVSRFGPGAAHLRELLKFAIERGFRRFDFTIGDESYKRDWCETEQHLYDHSAATTLLGWPITMLALARRRIKRMIKHSAPLWNGVVRARAAVASLRKQPEP